MMLGRISKRLLSSAKEATGLLAELKHRGLILQMAQPEQWLHDKLNGGHKIKLYCGADPTAKSLHLGNVVPLMILLNFYVRGHDVVALVGGATGRVGDPSGRKTERTAMNDDVRLRNIVKIQAQLQKFFDNGLKYYQSRFPQGEIPGKIVCEDNFHWWKDIRLLDFLAEYGRHIRIQSMFGRSSIGSRLEGKDGMGFNEFTYQILQAYDFYHLYEEQGVTVQVGGNDQWGNITAGIDLINRVSPRAQKIPVSGLTAPLLTTASGEKFGKSAGNAVFLDPEINSAFDIFQFFYNTEDADVSRFLKIFTLLSLDTIEAAMQQHMLSPHLRSGQTLLAREVTDLLFGVGSGDTSLKVSKIVFEKDTADQLSGDELIKLFDKAKILRNASKSDSLVDIIVKVASCSKSEARRKLSQGSIFLDFSRTKVTQDVSDLSKYLIDDKVLILRIGKQKCYVIKMQ
ncbi:MSY1 (YPL097W) [Zygosaccharomyces parabailii]|nr:MSY1 (YPL097W) [Zygosaccharomyces parabailii]